MVQLAQPNPTLIELPAVREVGATRPLQWLRDGWHDMSRLGRHSLAYGVFVAAAGIMLLALVWGASYLVPAFIGGFLLVAPFAAIGLYALSRQLDERVTIDPARALFAWRANRESIALFGLMLALALILWERLAAIVFALFHSGSVTDVSQLARHVLFSGQELPLLLAFFGLGGLLAATVFALSVVSAPMLLDRPVDVVTAVLTSLRCCRRNPGAMLVWAALLAGIMLIGFATGLLAMIVLFPWLGHASWRAYRDLVE